MGANANDPDGSVSVDDVLGVIGEFGPHQRRQYALVASAWIACAWVTLSMVFVNASPQWRSGTGKDVHSERPPCDGSDIVFTGAMLSIRSEFGLVCDDKWVLGLLDTSGLIDSLFFVGFGIGASLFGNLADKAGRRRAFLISGIVSSVACFLCAAARDWKMYAAFRCLTGTGIGGFGIVTYVLASEVIGPSWQGVTGVGQCFPFVLGEVSLALLAFLMPHWRDLTIVTGLGPLLFALAYYFVPESPRWLLANGQAGAANRVMAGIAKGNGTKVPLNCKLTVQSGSPGGSMSQLGTHPSLRLRILVMLYVWAATSFVYYGLSLNTGNLGGNLYATFALGALIEVPSLLAGVYFVDCLGRRRTLSCAMVLSGLACAACMVLPKGAAITAAAMVGKFGISAAFAIVFVYASELFPTDLRSGAMGLCSTSARVGGILAPVAVLLSHIEEALPLLVFGCAALVAGLLLLLLPETLGKPLPETVADCESGTDAGGDSDSDHSSGLEG